jgi:hypothetical protein
LCFSLCFRVLFTISAAVRSDDDIATRHFTGRAFNRTKSSSSGIFRLQFSPFCHVYYRCTNPFEVPCRVRQGRRRVDDAGRICSVCVQRRLFRGIIFPRTAVRSFATRKRLLPRVSNAPPTQPHCDPRRPSCMATSGCCCSFVAQRRRRKTGSRKMAGSKTIIIRSRRRPPIENESERCVTKRAKPSIDRSIDWYRLLLHHHALEMPLV